MTKKESRMNDLLLAMAGVVGVLLWLLAHTARRVQSLERDLTKTIHRYDAILIDLQRTRQDNEEEKQQQLCQWLKQDVRRENQVRGLRREMLGIYEQQQAGLDDLQTTGTRRYLTSLRVMKKVAAHLELDWQELVRKKKKKTPPQQVNHDLTWTQQPQKKQRRK